MDKIRSYYVADEDGKDGGSATAVMDIISGNKVYRSIPNPVEELQGVESLTVAFQERNDADWYESVLDQMEQEEAQILTDSIDTPTAYAAPIFPVLPGATFRWNHATGDVQATCVKCQAVTVWQVPMSQEAWAITLLTHTYSHKRDARSKYHGQPK